MVSYGKPLGPTLAIFFFGHLEKKIFANLENNSRVLTKVYLRYIDDYALF